MSGSWAVSCLERCPQFRGVLIIERGSTVVRECPQFRGVLIIERGSTVVRGVLSSGVSLL